ncbi:MAG TPA: spore germination protein [Clostridiaceae bacterium]|nr:spore germination protein [Clostridiaceae bacterium]
MKFGKFYNRTKYSTTKSEKNKETDEPTDTEVTSENVKMVLSDSSDVNYQLYYINGCRDLPVSVVFVDGLVDTKMVNDDILKPLTQEKVLMEAKNLNSIIDLIEHGTIYHASRKVRTNLGDTLADILSGAVALIFDREKKAITFDIKGFEKRAISEPTNESALKGSKDSFIEVLRVNTTLVRRKIRTPYLRIKETIVGKQSKTTVAVIYIENLANKKIVEEVLKRLNKINIDGATTVGSIEEYIIDNKYTIFPLVSNTERTDKFCHNILEGRVGLIIDGLPTAYIIPATITMFFQAPEDYAQNFIIGSFLRCVRYANSMITLFLPAFYISITTFHQEMIPTLLAITIIRSKAEVPFPTTTSIFFMLLAFEVLIEAGFRLPRTIGQTISIIGALVVGQAAVQAKIISPVVVIIIALTGMAGFTMPNQDFANAIRLCRLLFVLCSAIAGLYGLSLGFVLLIYHLNTLETYGVPYFSPFAANEGRDITHDTLIRVPLHLMKKRPSDLKTLNKKRQK